MNALLARLRVRYQGIPLTTTVLATLLLGAAGSGLWDMLFKPGLGRLGRLFLSMTTLGSHRIRDLAYESAALNPTPVAGLVGIAVLAWAPFVILAFVLGVRTSRSQRRESLTGDALGTGQRLARLISSERRASRVITVAMILVGVSTFTAGSVLNQAVLIWRVFNANLTICAPYLDSSDQTALRAEFASVRTAEDYGRIATKLETISRRQVRRLVSQALW